MLDFGEWRSLVHARPSTAVFERIIEHVEREEQSDRERVEQEVLPYLVGALQAWPDELRSCPKTLLKKFEGEEPLWGALVRALDYYGESLGVARVERLMEAPIMRQITHLNLGAANISWSVLNDFCRHNAFESLTSFAFYRTGYVGEEDIQNLFNSPMLEGVKHISFERWSSMKAFVFEALEEAPWLDGLKTLNLRGCRVSKKRLASLIETGRLDNLEGFNLQRTSGYEACYKGCLGLAAQRLPGLKSLAGVVMTRADGEQLLASPLPLLESLDVEVVQNSNAFLRRLCEGAERAWSSRLSALSLSEGGAEGVVSTPPVVSEGRMESLESLAHFDALKSLAITVIEPDPSWLESLAHMPALHALERLEVQAVLCDEERRVWESWLRSPLVENLSSFQLSQRSWSR